MKQKLRQETIGTSVLPTSQAQSSTCDSNTAMPWTLLSKQQARLLKSKDVLQRGITK